MSLSLFFAITGTIFTILSSIIIKNLYDMYPINKVTEFIKPTEETIFNKISTSILPLIIWSIIEVPVIGYNSNFLLGLLLNITINCSLTYIIIYGHSLLGSEEGKILSITSIIIASIMGFMINYLTLFVGHMGYLLNSIIGIILLIALFTTIRMLKPNILIFKKEKK